MRNGRAVMMPIWVLLAPIANANATRNPPDANPSAAEAETACHVAVRSPPDRSSSESAALGLNSPTTSN
jgi:hypothetical protein